MSAIVITFIHLVIMVVGVILLYERLTDADIIDCVIERKTYRVLDGCYIDVTCCSECSFNCACEMASLQQYCR